MNIVGYRNNATPDAAFGPGAESAPARRPAAAPHFQGEQLPRQPGAQHKQDAPEDLVVAHEGSPKRLAWLPFLGQLRLYDRPERVVDERFQASRTITNHVLQRALTDAGGIEGALTPPSDVISGQAPTELARHEEALLDVPVESSAVATRAP